MQITVLGAGYMGTAMAIAAWRRGHRVKLWGTWLDNPLLDPVLRGEAHPRLKLVLPTFEVHRAEEAETALRGADLVIFGVSSDGAVEVVRRLTPFLPDVPFVAVTKGLLPAKSGRMERVDLVLAETLGRPLRYVHAGGPAKAMELARETVTWMVFAGQDAKAAADALGGGTLHIEVSLDLAGGALCSATKNAYATGLGLWDGLIGKDCHNARAACFTQALYEMEKLVLAAGGTRETVFGAAGVGDLHVTAAAGRNRLFGERVGTGRPAREVADEMLKTGELTEGYPAIRTIHRFAEERGVSDLPFLSALHAVVWEGAEVKKTLGSLRFARTR